MKPRVIVIVGPTASGKTSASIKLAKKIKVEIISSNTRGTKKGPKTFSTNYILLKS